MRQHQGPPPYYGGYQTPTDDGTDYSSSGASWYAMNNQHQQQQQFHTQRMMQMPPPHYPGMGPGGFQPMMMPRGDLVASATMGAHSLAGGPRDRGGQKRPANARAEPQNVAREISNHPRDKGVVCARFFFQGDCLIVNCPYAHLQAHTLKPVPSTQCKFWPEGRCLRDSCPYFHGSIEDLKNLRESRQTAYRPVMYMPQRDPMRVLAVEELDLRSCDMAPGILHEFPLNGHPSLAPSEQTLRPPTHQPPPVTVYETPVAQPQQPVPLQASRQRAGPPEPVGMEGMRPSAVPWSPPNAQPTEIVAPLPPRSLAPPRPISPPVAPPAPTAEPGMHGISVQLPWELLTPEQQRMVIEHQRRQQS